MNTRVTKNFIIVFRLSLMDLVEEGSQWQEVVTLGKAIQEAGATLINSGIGWHEARVPTIASSVPQGAFTGIVEKFRKHTLKSVILLPKSAVGRGVTVSAMVYVAVHPSAFVTDTE